MHRGHEHSHHARRLDNCTGRGAQRRQRLVNNKPEQRLHAALAASSQHQLHPAILSCHHLQPARATTACLSPFYRYCQWLSGGPMRPQDLATHSVTHTRHDAGYEGALVAGGGKRTNFQY